MHCSPIPNSHCDASCYVCCSVSRMQTSIKRELMQIEPTLVLCLPMHTDMRSILCQASTAIVSCGGLGMMIELTASSANSNLVCIFVSFLTWFCMLCMQLCNACRAAPLPAAGTPCANVPNHGVFTSAFLVFAAPLDPLLRP